MKYVKPAISLCFMSLLCLACTHKELALPDCKNIPTDRTISYHLDVIPIVRNNCTLSGCHMPGFEHGDFTLFAALKEKAVNGLLEEVILTNAMPPGFADEEAALTDCDKQLLLTWIEEGTLNN